jgi:hypothetical protein
LKSVRDQGNTERTRLEKFGLVGFEQVLLPMDDGTNFLPSEVFLEILPRRAEIPKRTVSGNLEILSANEAHN